MQVVGQVQGILERFQVAIAQQIQQLGMQQQYHQAIHQQMLQQILQQQQEQKVLLQRREEGPSRPTGWPQVYMQPPGNHPALSKQQQPLLQLPPLLQSIPTASKSERPPPKPRAKSQAEEKLSERSMKEASPCHPQAAEETKDATPATPEPTPATPEPTNAEKETKETKEVKEEQEGQEGDASDTIEVVAPGASPASPSKPETAHISAQSMDTATAPRDELSGDGECVSRVERTHEEVTRQKELEEKRNQRSQKYRETEESGRWSKNDKWKETQASYNGRNQGVTGQRSCVAAPRRSRWRTTAADGAVAPRRMGKAGPRAAAAETETSETRDTRPTRGKMNQRSGEVQYQWRTRHG